MVKDVAVSSTASRTAYRAAIPGWNSRAHWPVLRAILDQPETPADRLPVHLNRARRDAGVLLEDAGTRQVVDSQLRREKG